MTQNQPKGKRQAKKEATRAAILSAARRCFAEHGFADTHVAHISRAAGVAHGTFYVHFPNKVALVDELRGAFNEELRLLLMPVMTSGETLPEKVRAVAETFLTHWADNRAFVEAYAQRLASGLTLEELRDGINPEAASLLRIALTASGAVRPGAASVVTQGILALWMRIGLQHLFAEPPVPRALAVELLTNMTLGALAGVASGNEDDDATG